MRKLSTKASDFTACYGLGRNMFGLRCTKFAEKPAEILICNQGVVGSSPPGGTPSNQ